MTDTDVSSTLMPFRLCNHPDLLLPASQAAGDTGDEPLGELATLAQPVFPEGYMRGLAEHSGSTAHILVGLHARMTRQRWHPGASNGGTVCTRSPETFLLCVMHAVPILNCMVVCIAIP